MTILICKMFAILENCQDQLLTIYFDKIFETETAQNFGLQDLILANQTKGSHSPKMPCRIAAFLWEFHNKELLRGVSI